MSRRALWVSRKLRKEIESNKARFGYPLVCNGNIYLGGPTKHEASQGQRLQGRNLPNSYTPPRPPLNASPPRFRPNLGLISEKRAISGLNWVRFDNGEVFGGRGVRMIRRSG